jgi:hypothetical protein
MNFKLFFSLLVLFTCVNAIAFIKPYQTSQIFKSPLAQKYYEKYDKIHVDALNRIKKEFNITDEDWRLSMETLADIVKQDTLFASYSLDRSSIFADDHRLIKEAKEILIQYGIDPKNIEIKLDYDPNENISAGQKLEKEKDIIKHTLSINPDYLETLLPEEQESMIRHEITHLACYDPLEKKLIDSLLQIKGHTKEAIENNSAIISYNHQCETRADILAVVDNPVLAKACYGLWVQFAQSSKLLPAGYWNLNTHPPFETRAQNFAQLLVEINQPQLA